MPDADDIKDALASDLEAGIQSTSLAGQTTTLMPVEDRIAGAQFVAGETAKQKPHRGMMFTKFIPPAAG